MAWSSNQYIRTQLTGTLNLATAGTEEAVNKYLSGWSAGCGLALAFSKNWNVFAEYRYTSFGSSTITLPFSQLSTTSKTNLSEIDFGVNYKFDWSAPPGGGPAMAANSGRPALVYKAPRGSYIYDWTGFYIGGDSGYSWDTSSGTLTTAEGVPLAPYSYGVEGPFAGGFIGGNYQFNRFVVGVEGDWQWSNLIGNSEAASSFTVPSGVFPGGPFTVSTTIKDYGSVRGRLGLAFDHFLFFGTAGWAFGNPSTAYALTNPPTTYPPTGGTWSAVPFVATGGYSYGWTAGAGIDYAFTNNVLGRIEYRHTDLGTSRFVNAATDSAETGNKVPINDFRVGIAYKFGGWPVLARF